MRKERKNFLSGDELEKLLREANFSDIEIKETYSSQSILISGKKLK